MAFIDELDAADRALEEFRKERLAELQLDAACGSGGAFLQGEPDAQPARADEDQVDAEEDAQRIGAGVGPLGDDDDAQQQGDQGRDGDPAPPACRPPARSRRGSRAPRRRSSARCPASG